MLTIISPIVNGFYPILLASIAAASAFELALRVYDARAIAVAAAVSELCVVAATGYGCIAAVLHGVHERQVLPGMDDAVVETVLLKRNALKESYSHGKCANPAPLGYIMEFEKVRFVDFELIAAAAEKSKSKIVSS